MQFDQLKRREFITLLGGATVAWQRCAPSSRDEFLISLGRNDRANLAQAFRRGLSE
jgi:hypothetical protein